MSSISAVGLIFVRPSGRVDVGGQWTSLAKRNRDVSGGPYNRTSFHRDERRRFASAFFVIMGYILFLSTCYDNIGPFQAYRI